MFTRALEDRIENNSTCVTWHLHSCNPQNMEVKDTERERERNTEREIQREKYRERNTEREIQREKYRERNTEREIQREREKKK